MAHRAKRAWRFGKRIAQAFAEDSGGLLAAAVAFYGLVSLVPLLSLGVSVLGFVVGGSEEALSRIQEAAEGALPGSREVVFNTLREIQRDRGIAGFVGIIGLLISGSAIFTNLELALNNMWRVTVMRAWWKQRLVAFGTALLTLALLFASLAITSVITVIKTAEIPIAGGTAGSIPYLWTVLGNLVPLSLSILMFTLIYKIVPNCRVGWSSAFRGGLFAGGAWELAKYLFAWYVANFANYNKVYGSLGAVISLMFWAYYSAVILFVGGEIAADRARRDPLKEPPPPNPVPHPRRENDPPGPVEAHRPADN